MQELLSRLGEMADAKTGLTKTDSVRYITDDREVKFNLDVEWSPETIEELYVKEIIKRPPSPMILLVKRPDYIGNSQWEFRHGKQPISAKIADEKWLRDFQSRRADVRPGDALRCQVSQEVRYGYDNEVISERYVITEVSGVLESRAQQLNMLGDDGEL